jgi:hypothetical protein
MAEHFAAEIPRNGVLGAEGKLKSSLVKRTDFGCLSALHALSDNRTLLLRLLNSFLFSLLGTNWSDLGQRAELVPDLPISCLFLAIKSDQRRRIILGAGDRE